MKKIEVSIKDRDISMISFNNEKIVEKIRWKDKANISKNFLVKFDKINNCNKHKINCFFSQKSDSDYKPKLIVLRRLGGESTTYRIALASLRVLEWAGMVTLQEKNGK